MSALRKGDIARSRNYGWQCRVEGSRRPEGNIPVRWLDGPFATREASPLAESLVLEERRSQPSGEGAVLRDPRSRRSA